MPPGYRECWSCHLPVAECLCDEDGRSSGTLSGMRENGEVSGLIRAMLGADPAQADGPPYVHVHSFPMEPGEDDEAEWEPPPPAFTVTARSRGRQYENGPIEVPAAFKRLNPEMLADTADIGSYWPPDPL